MTYLQWRALESWEVITTSKTEMTKEAAARIQSHADRTGTNKEFAIRAQSSADKRESTSESSK